MAASELLAIDNLRFAWPGDDRPVLAVEQLRLAQGERSFSTGRAVPANPPCWR